MVPVFAMAFLALVLLKCLQQQSALTGITSGIAHVTYPLDDVVARDITRSLSLSSRLRAAQFTSTFEGGTISSSTERLGPGFWQMVASAEVKKARNSRTVLLHESPVTDSLLFSPSSIAWKNAEIPCKTMFFRPGIRVPGESLVDCTPPDGLLAEQTANSLTLGRLRIIGNLISTGVVRIAGDASKSGILLIQGHAKLERLEIAEQSGDLELVALAGWNIRQLQLGNGSRVLVHAIAGRVEIGAVEYGPAWIGQPPCVRAEAPAGVVLAAQLNDTAAGCARFGNGPHWRDRSIISDRGEKP